MTVLYLSHATSTHASAHASHASAHASHASTSHHAHIIMAASYMNYVKVRATDVS